MNSWITPLIALTLAAGPVWASDGLEPLVDESFDGLVQDEAEAPEAPEAETDAPVEDAPAVEEAPAVEAEPEPTPVVEEAPLVSPEPVVAAPPPAGVTQPRDTTDVATLMLVAAGGVAVGALAGAMGCCVLFFAFYY